MARDNDDTGRARMEESREEAGTVYPPASDEARCERRLRIAYDYISTKPADDEGPQTYQSERTNTMSKRSALLRSSVERRRRRKTERDR
jgi:hypothetical protein